MLDTAPTVSAGTRELNVRKLTSTIVDVPTVRPSETSVTAQNYVIVRVQLANGVEGIGEAATLGGPRWSEEGVEAIQANIDTYLAPALLGVRETPSRRPVSVWMRRLSETTPQRQPLKPHSSML